MPIQFGAPCRDGIFLLFLKALHFLLETRKVSRLFLHQRTISEVRKKMAGKTIREQKGERGGGEGGIGEGGGGGGRR